MGSPKILIVMGVSGCGKSTIGKLLARELMLPYFDGDDFHPKENVAKMSNGEPLTDVDREGWLMALNALAKKNTDKGAVIACSALKEVYRSILQDKIDPYVRFIYLEGTYDEINQRMQERKDHFMPTELLKSQFATLEPPKKALRVSIKNLPEEIVKDILKQL